MSEFVILGREFEPTPSPSISWLHHWMYSGEGLRDNVDLRIAGNRLLGEAGGPMSLIRSGTYWPEVFSPCDVHFTVSERIRDQLIGFSGFDLCEVEFRRLVDLNVAWDDHSMEESWLSETSSEGDAPFHFLPILPVNWPHHKYFEIVMPHYQRVMSIFKNRPLAEAEYWHSRTGWSRRYDLLVSQELLEEFPIFWDRGGIVIAGKVWEVLSPHLDRRIYYLLTRARVKE